MNEVEVKIIDIDVAAVEARLLALGAVKTFEGEIQASLFDYPDNRLESQRSLLRVRHKGDTVELAFKQNIADPLAKRYDELEVLVSDREAMEQILQRIGLRETVHGRRKHRVSYALEGAHVELDTFEGMPTFLEIEVADSSLIQGWVENLGFSMADAKAWSGRDIHRHYNVPYPLV